MRKKWALLFLLIFNILFISCQQALMDLNVPYITEELEAQYGGTFTYKSRKVITSNISYLYYDSSKLGKEVITRYEVTDSSLTSCTYFLASNYLQVLYKEDYEAYAAGLVSPVVAKDGELYCKSEGCLFFDITWHPDAFEDYFQYKNEIGFQDTFSQAGNATECVNLILTMPESEAECEKYIKAFAIIFNQNYYHTPVKVYFSENPSAAAENPGNNNCTHMYEMQYKNLYITSYKKHF